MTRNIFLALVFLAMLNLTASSTVFAGIYRWTDDRGTLHITDDPDKIPEKYRGQTDGRALGKIQTYNSPDFVKIKIPPSNSRKSSASWYSGASGYSQALKEHKRTRKPLAVYFYTDWCGYCKKFEKNTLPRSNVKQYMNSIIKVRINPDKGTREKSLARQYSVGGYPSFFMVSGKRGTRKKIYGLFDPASFIKACKRAE